jgi:hypothetical protein
MSLSIELRTESGEIVEAIADSRNVLHRLLPPYGVTSSVLSGIDWYGDTVFNRLQVKQLLDEWEKLFRLTSDMEEHSFEWSQEMGTSLSERSASLFEIHWRLNRRSKSFAALRMTA